MLIQLTKVLRALCANSKAGTAIEYGLIVSLIVIAMIASLKTLAGVTIGMWSNVSTQVEATTH
jgi:pilus assembly protein Flp/PilA